MKLSTTDYAVIVAFFAVNLGIGLYYARRGGTSVSEYFLSGRNVPWWLAGISMVATTFARRHAARGHRLRHAARHRRATGCGGTR